ncbi:M13 family metallopeptidase [Stenotrophomonas oahuensis]|uniref:M13 family metallopeptidase n=1 Tax=Stenotrophomonas oahuensis TaxID=3003271 RepID=A0ABY9YR32_9GAMM|nr:M13 family metallopeptidase [Stenotrophomonas sp. A5586]WNH53182.1 M13 family metallopeptidase [Stenotrophomonas sp. A5586]
MRTEIVSQQRRVQGQFERALRGRQPPQAHGQAQHPGGHLPVLHVRNVAQAVTVGLLLGTMLPGAQASTPGSGYTAVNLDVPLQAASTAAAGCLARPASCPQMLMGASLVAVGSLTAGAWIGWQARSQHAGDPCIAALSAAARGSEAAHQLRNQSASLDAPITLGFRATQLDSARDPCVSLYDHVNGRWANTTALADNQSRWHISNALEHRGRTQQRALAEQLATLPAPTPAQRVVADLWTSGMDESHINSDRLRPLRGELAAIDALTSPQDIEKHLYLLTLKGRNPVFGVVVEPDMGNRSTQIAYAYQGGLGLPSAAHYLSARQAALHRDYRAYIAALLELSGTPADQAHNDAVAVFALEQRLATASTSRAELRDNLAETYNPMRAAEADVLTPNFRWSGLFESLGADPSIRFSLATPGFHREVSAALSDTDVATWRTYLRFHCLDTASPHLDDRFVQTMHDFQQRLLGVNQTLAPRWQRVLGSIDAYAGDALGEAYVGAHFPAEVRGRISQMVEQMRTVLKRRLATALWLDPDTRVTAQAKADLLNPRIGHPDQWPDWSELRTERCGYLRNLRLLRTFQQRLDLARIGQPLDAQRWRISAHSVNAYFDVMNNDMGFPAGLLQPPIFDPEADHALNYGAIGVIIGHEMSHAFSAETSQFALNGQLQHWWTEDDRARYQDLSRRLALQYDQQRIEGLAVNGTLTANENMADLGGLMLALEALREQSGAASDPMIDGLSREQRFFISWAHTNRQLQTPQRLRLELAANPHSFGAPRTDVAASNLPAYAAAFDCPPGSAMARSGEQQVAYL